MEDCLYNCPLRSRKRQNVHFTNLKDYYYCSLAVQGIDYLSGEKCLVHVAYKVLNNMLKTCLKKEKKLMFNTFHLIGALLFNLRKNHAILKIIYVHKTDLIG